ncbi:MAG: helix-turn-helix transcriptional regulator [Negativicutes bacterium]|nr:helix-turn-helix transcriptional regulator [Negativicutes bacterium]
MQIATAAQVRAARGLLNWSQTALASAAKVSRATIQNIENEYAVRHGKAQAVHTTLIENGIEFLEGDGVKRVPDGIKDFMGNGSCDRFFNHVAKILKETGGDLICEIQTQDILTKATCASHRTNLQRMADLRTVHNVKCLMLEENSSLQMPGFDIRVFPDENPLSTSSFTYGNETAMAFADNKGNFVYVVFHMAHLVASAKNYFAQRWVGARQVSLLTSAQRKRA